MNTSSLLLSLGSLLLALPLVGCQTKECTDMGCAQSARIDFTFTEPGAYVFEVTVDGAKATCRATLPLPRGPSAPCDRDEVLLGLVGSELPADQQSISGLILQTTTAKTVAIRATRDGALIGEKTIELAYTVTPGPNGPGCEPKECRAARATFP